MTLACVIHGPRDLRLEPTPALVLGPLDVQVRLGAAGICGSDLHYYRDGRVGAFVIREPFVPGHEASGVVEVAGSAVTRVKVGDRVAINPAHACGHCAPCRAGRANLCAAMYFMGSASIFPHAQGMFREAFVMAESQLTPITEPDISLGEIACAEPLSIGLHAISRAGPVLGETVLVVGAGTIGCMAIIAARLAGAARVIACDVQDRALALAHAIGADQVQRSDQVAATDMADSADVAIEAAGHPSALNTCLTAIRRGGRIVQVGTLPAEVSFPANSIMTRELTYLGAFRANHAFDWAVQAIRTRRVDVRPLITAQFPLTRSKEAFELALDRTQSAKVQLIAS